MTLDKVLNRIQMQIKELAPTLELFVEDSIQPSVKDCEELQKQICILQENLAVYKHHKQEKELSPSFNIHAKVSTKDYSDAQKEKERLAMTEKEKDSVGAENKERLVMTEEDTKNKERIVKTEKEKEDEKRKEVEKHKTDHMVLINDEPVIKAGPLVIGINDKFRFINELFKQNSGEYNIAAEQLSAVRTWSEAEVYLNSLKELYGWQEKNEVVIYFYSVVKKRFT